MDVIQNKETDLGCEHVLLSGYENRDPTNEVQTEENDCDPIASFNKLIDSIGNKVKLVLTENKCVVKRLLYIFLCISLLAYVTAACIINFERARIVLYIAIFILACVVYSVTKKAYGESIVKNLIQPIHENIINKHRKVIRWTFIFLFVAFAGTWIIRDSVEEPYRLVSLTGLIGFTFIGFLLSSHRKRIRWRPVFCGFALQFVFALLILGTEYGYAIFKWVGDRVIMLLKFSQVGGSFVFGDLKALAFSVFPIIPYFSALTYLLWYLGVIQVLVEKIGWLLAVSLGTTPAESLNAAANIFLGSQTAPLLILPFLQKMTDSELHTVMTSGFATIGGGALAIFISLGISATHLISASIISAPAALAMSKLIFPEVEKSPGRSAHDVKMEKPNEKNMFAAIAEGARISITAVASVVVNIIAFLGLLKCCNSILGWLGSMVNVPQLSFEFICSYVFMPFALLMGVPWNDVLVVAELLGINTFVNSLIAYQRLSLYMSNRENGITNGKIISIRGEVITTYALCGFSGVVSVGVTLGVLGSFIPQRKGVLAKHVIRALFAGTMACFSTACLAGLLFDERSYRPSMIHVRVNSTTSPLNSTMNTP